MVDIESKIEDLLSNSKLIPKADIKQLLENTKKKISSIILDFIFKNNLEIIDYLLLIYIIIAIQMHYF